MKKCALDRTDEAMREWGVLRYRDLRELGIRSCDMFFLTFVGGVRHYGAGLYYRSNLDPSPEVLASRRVNNATLCLLSALHVYRFFKDEPERVWLAIPRSQRRPLPLVAPLEVIRVSNDLHSTGFTVEYAGGVPVRVTTLVRTAVDCLRFRHKVGIDVARMVLRVFVLRGVCSPDELIEEARRCRVARVMREELSQIRPEFKEMFREQRRKTRRKEPHAIVGAPSVDADQGLDSGRACPGPDD